MRCGFFIVIQCDAVNHKICFSDSKRTIKQFAPNLLPFGRGDKNPLKLSLSATGSVLSFLATFASIVNENLAKNYLNQSKQNVNLSGGTK